MVADSGMLAFVAQVSGVAMGFAHYRACPRFGGPPSPALLRTARARPPSLRSWNPASPNRPLWRTQRPSPLRP